jgi:ribonucleoside-diphosphate reductase alpha chain
MKKIELTPNALTIAQKRYFMEGEDWDKCVERVASVVSVCEEHKIRDRIKDDFYDIIYNQYFLPGGRILRNCGRPRGSLFNCYHLPIGDNIEQIGQLIKDSLILWSEGGGVGINFSPLRPRGDAILGKGGTSSGLVSFIEAADAVSHTIESGGSRRAAAIAHVDISHPEVLDFIDAKLLHKKLSHFNISVAVNNEFLETVEANGNWTFKFKQKSYATVKARDIWNKIVENMITCAEPGLINWTNFYKNNSWYFAPICGTNPCGETVLEKYGVCDLGSLVLPNFIPEGGTNTNWKKLEQTIQLAVRFLDNIIEVNKYTLKEIDISAHRSRRVGIGILGMAEYLFAKKVRYGSEKAVIEVERVMKFIRDIGYKASVDLAIEKGAFPSFEPIQYGKSSFIRKLPASLRMDIKKYGVRNCTLLALAPTGTISLLTQYSSGVEPLFAKAMLRKDKVGERVYVHPIYEQLLENNEEVPEWFVDSFDLEPKDHFETQVAAQKFTDGAVSKTINLPKGSTTDELSELLLEYIYDLKGVTVYVDGSREGQILNKLTPEEIKKYIKDKKIEREMGEMDIQCASGSCEM